MSQELEPPATFTGSAPFWEVWAEASTPQKLNSFTYFYNELCMYFRT